MENLTTRNSFARYQIVLLGLVLEKACGASLDEINRVAREVEES